MRPQNHPFRYWIMKISNAKYIYELYRIADSNNFVFGFNLVFLHLFSDFTLTRTAIAPKCHCLHGGIAAQCVYVWWCGVNGSAAHHHTKATHNSFINFSVLWTYIRLISIDNALLPMHHVRTHLTIAVAELAVAILSSNSYFTLAI